MLTGIKYKNDGVTAPTILETQQQIEGSRLTPFLFTSHVHKA